jgi:plasmid stabilization system protein ParE
MKLRASFRRIARLEYEEAALWYESQAAGLGVRFIEEIERAIGNVCEEPDRFPLMLGDVRAARVRRFPYSLFFRIRDEQAVVLAVFHARRDPNVWRQRA